VQLLVDLERSFQPRPLNVYVYGDATGEQPRTSASRTDWQIAKNCLGRYPDRYQANFHVSSSNPLVKDRVNCANAMLHNYAGERCLLIDPNQVAWKADPHGNSVSDLDKSIPCGRT
jgi:hypothetical protein